MALNNQSDSSELKKRFDVFHREARFEDKPYRLLGRPQITDKLVTALFGYPEQVADKTVFVEGIVNALKAYGLDASEPTRQKSAVRIQSRLLAVETDEASKGQ